MSGAAFVLVVVAVGVLYLYYFSRLKGRYGRKHPGEDNPVEDWLRPEEHDEEKKEQR